jgi:hypothetical protein
MRRALTILLTVLGLAFAATTLARDIEDGKLVVYPAKDGKYKIGDFQGDKVGFYGVVGDWWERKHITGILMKKGENASAEQKHVVYVTAKQLKIDAFVEIDGKEQKIVEADPTPPPPPAAPPAPAAQPDPNQH